MKLIILCDARLKKSVEVIFLFKALTLLTGAMFG